MNQVSNISAHLPTIVKYTEPLRNGIRSHTLSRYAIGYVFQGSQYIYEGDRRHIITSGDMFYLGVGCHYIEYNPDNEQPFEQIVFYYTPAELQRALLWLNTNYGLSISNNHSCDSCLNHDYVSIPANSAIRNFFIGIDYYLKEGYVDNPVAEHFKLTELINLLAYAEDSCIKHKLLTNIDSSKESFEQIIHDNIFKDISIKELADLTRKSPTAFKKEFSLHFQMPPHKWFIRKRLVHARLQLISTSKSITEIGHLCAFPNTSHFIKLFKKEYQMTPANYRKWYRTSPIHHTHGEQRVKQVVEAERADIR